MNTENRYRAGIAGTVFSFSLFVVLSAAFFLFSPGPGAAWNGYSLVLIDRNSGVENAAQILARGGFPGVVSEETVSVRICGYDGFEMVPLARIRERFDPADPRLDRWIRNLPRYFQGSDGERDYRVYYVPSEMNRLWFFLRMRELFADFPGDWKIAESSPLRPVILFTVYAVLLIAVLLTAKRDRVILFMGSLPWLSFLVHQNIPAFSASSLMYLGWALVFQDLYPVFLRQLHYGENGFIRDVLRKIGGLTLLLAVHFMLAIVFSYGRDAVLPVIAGTAGVIFLSTGAVLSGYVRGLSREHRLFIPVSILAFRSGRGSGGRVKALVPVLVLLVFLLPFAIGAADRKERFEVPRFRGAGGAEGFSLTSLEKLWEDRSSTDLPDLSEYFAHRAYQDAFLYGREYGFPGRNESVVLNRYRDTGETVVEYSEVAVSFSDSWFQSVLEEIQSGGIEGMLLSQKEPGKVVANQKDAVPAGKTFFPETLILCVIFLGITALIRKNLTSPTLYGMRSSKIRRNRQIA